MFYISSFLSPNPIVVGREGFLVQNFPTSVGLNNALYLKFILIPIIMWVTLPFKLDQMYTLIGVGHIKLLSRRVMWMNTLSYAIRVSRKS